VPDKKSQLAQRSDGLLDAVDRLKETEQRKRHEPIVERQRPASRALEDWQAAKKALDQATPWTAEWQRLRLVEEERRLAYLALIDRQQRRYTVMAKDDGKHWVARVQGQPELTTTAHRFDEALAMLRELIATVEDIDPLSIKLDVEFESDPTATKPPR
jgi:hypothetical protein